MIAADTSSLVAYLSGADGDDVDLLDEALHAWEIRLPAVVLAEILSDPRLEPTVVLKLRTLPLLDIAAGYWERAGALRASLAKAGYKPNVADSLIAQSCLDHDVALITRDRGFRAYQKVAGLRLVP